MEENFQEKKRGLCILDVTETFSRPGAGIQDRGYFIPVGLLRRASTSQKQRHSNL